MPGKIQFKLDSAKNYRHYEAASPKIKNNLEKRAIGGFRVPGSKENVKTSDLSHVL